MQHGDVQSELNLDPAPGLSEVRCVSGVGGVSGKIFATMLLQL